LRLDLADSGGALEVVAGDLTDWDFALSVRDRVEGRPVRGLVNSAGTIGPAGIEAEDLSCWKRVIGTNLDTAFNLTKLLLPALRSAGSASIVNVSSVCGSRPCTSLSYSVSKAGIEMFTKCLAHDLARYNIRVNAVSPGVVPTNLQTAAGLFHSTDAYRDWLLSASATHPLGRVGEPGEVAQAILFLLGDSAGWITGTTLNVDGGLSLS
jgi:NAD(P)-dependent dehydrogenase (short-subunit alcohol dehydrogenase family)